MNKDSIFIWCVFAFLAAEGRTTALTALTNLGRKTLHTTYSYHKVGLLHASSSPELPATTP
jgi:hypothetical protein